MAEHIVIREPRDLAPSIDHTILAPQATEAQVVQLCIEARTYGFRAVCVNPIFVRPLRRPPRRQPSVVCSVVGFRSAPRPPRTRRWRRGRRPKAGRARSTWSCRSGRSSRGTMPTSRRTSPRWPRPRTRRSDLEGDPGDRLPDGRREGGRLRAARKAGADFVKTSTGSRSGGATAPDVRLMRRTVGAEMGVKAAGGIRTYEAALSMIEAGATRIGASASVSIIGGGKHPPDA